MFEKLRRDCSRCPDPRLWILDSGFWLVAIYRFGSWARRLPWPLRLPLSFLAHLVAKPATVITKVSIPFSAEIGPGFRLIHPRDIMIGGAVRIGENCLVFHEVTIGQGPVPGQPVLGNGVDVYVGARILGGVNIGDDVQVGANCVVLKDVPAGSVVVPPLARVMPRETVAKMPRGRDALRGASSAGPDGDPAHRR